MSKYILITEEKWNSLWDHYIYVIPHLTNKEDISRYLYRLKAALSGDYQPNFSLECLRVSTNDKNEK